MTRAQMLAASSRPLAEVLVDALRRAARTPLRTRSDEHDDGLGESQLEMRLDDEDESTGEANVVSVLRPDEVAVAVLLGRALDGARDLLAKLQDRDTIVVIEVPAPEFVDPIKRLLRLYVLGIDAPMLDAVELSARINTVAASGTVALFVGKDEGRTKKAEKEDAQFAAAVQRRCAIIGIAAEPGRLLPSDLVRLAEHHIVVPRLDGAAVAAVIEAVTGHHPGPIDEQLAKRVTLQALELAVRGDLGVERSVARLRQLLGGPAKGDEAGALLSEIHGLGRAKEWGLNLAADLRAYAAGKLSWAAVDKGCLLTGPPGVGKTSFARALAREAGNVHFVATSYAQWQAHREGHLGHVTQAIREAFSEAQQNAPSIIFLDEIDTIPARNIGIHSDWWRAIATTLLECLDGFERREGVVVIAACNGHPTRLDPALIRAGRLDRHIEIPLPDMPALMGIFRAHLGNDLQGVDLQGAALAARGRTGADVERWVREARGRARRAGGSITLDLLLDVIRDGAPEVPLSVRKRLGYHEAGHAIASLALRTGKVLSLSIGSDGGLTRSEPDEMQVQTRAALEHYLVILLAGRAAEELVFGEATAGAGGSENSDLARATWIATRIEFELWARPLWSGLAAGGQHKRPRPAPCSAPERPRNPGAGLCRRQRPAGRQPDLARCPRRSAHRAQLSRP